MPDPRRTRRAVTDEELDRLAEFSEEDKESAAAAWRRDAPPEARALIDAEPYEPNGKRAEV